MRISDWSSDVCSSDLAWRNLKHRQQWRNSIRTHANALLKKPIGEIMVNDVVAVLMPIWRSTPETAGRLRGRIENILDAATAANHISSPWAKPARWKGNLIHLPPLRRAQKTEIGSASSRESMYNDV